MNDAARALIGRTVGGRFQLVAFLGEGAMASVFRGRQDGEPRDVAVKIMHSDLLQDATFAKRFSREAKAAAAIEHRNSVRILEHGADGELLYLAMELLTGEDLFDLLARERRLPEARAARIVTQICGALAAAHAQGIVHRDLKPENVMILPDPDHVGGQPAVDLIKVLDFGIAKIVERGRRDPRDVDPDAPVESAPPSSVLTRVGTLVGTPEYMSPEQSLGQPVDSRSDLYSCGVLLFHIVTGRPPFTGKAPIDVMMQQVDKPPPAPGSLVPNLHPGLEQVILKALSKARDARHQTAEELAGELEALLPELGRTSRPMPPPASDPSSGLRGVPGAVKIQSPGEQTRRSPVPAVRGSDPPPETLRSPATEGPTETPPATVVVVEAAVAMGAPPGAAPVARTVEKPAALPAPEAVVRAVVVPPPQPRPRAPAVERTPAPVPSVAPAPKPAAPLMAPGRGRRIPLWWMIAMGLAILSGLAWLVRYLRFG